MDSSSAPLADYFWIAGIDSISYSDPVLGGPNLWDKAANGAGPPSPQVDATIEEGSEGEAASSPPPRATARHSRNNSWNKLGKVPCEVRNSIQSLDDIGNGNTHSNRSSMTIRAPTANGNANGNGNRDSGVLGDFDFDRALVKFANERENFLDDLSFTAGAPVQKPPPMTIPRADRIRIEDTLETNGSGPGLGKRSNLRSVGGSIRRRISFRDMSSMKRQPSTVQRTSELGFFPP